MSAGPSEESNSTSVLIVGGGIGGLMLGAVLETANISYRILERAVESRPLGSSLGLTGNILPVFEQLGIFEDLKKISKPQSDVDFYDMKGNKIGNVTSHGQTRICGYEGYLLSRPRLYELVRNQVPSHKISMGKKVLRTKEENDKVTVYCADDTTYECKILVGADGAYSAVRQSMYKELDEKGILPKIDKDEFSIGFINMVGVATISNPEKYPDLSDDLAHYRVLIGDKNSSTSAGTITDNQICWGIQVQLSASNANEQRFQNSEWGPESIEAMMKEYEDYPFPYGGTMKDMFDATPKELISKVFLEEKIFKTWHHGRTVLIGDACHKISPGAGQGAVMAMKDAVILANCIYNLKDDSTSSIKSAFESYYAQSFKDGETQVQNGANASKIMLGHTWIQRVIRYILLSHPPYWILDREYAKAMPTRLGDSIEEVCIRSTNNNDTSSYYVLDEIPDVFQNAQ
ncbi:hypothetical protein BGZ49_008840 [Haplosporangium sp. Z 27]|nr:hypothetical protein BGZ49_008840 [Haplosporangium sp. Z 27]